MDKLASDKELGRPMCYADVLQKVMWTIDRLGEIPAKIVGEE